jgi:hypothetical protein
MISHIRRTLLLAACAITASCGGCGEEGSPTGGGSGSAGVGLSGGGNVGGSSGTGSATLSWMPPAENTDASTVTSLAGYDVCGGSSGDTLALAKTVANPGITTVMLEGLAAGTHYFAVSAYLASGVESDSSAVGSKSIL